MFTRSISLPLPVSLASTRGATRSDKRDDQNGGVSHMIIFTPQPPITDPIPTPPPRPHAPTRAQHPFVTLSRWHLVTLPFPVPRSLFPLPPTA